MLLGENAGLACVKVLKKIVSPITMYRMLYMKMVEREYFFFLRNKYPQRFGRMNYRQFKEYVKNNDSTFYEWFKKNYLTPDQKQFKENRITPLIIQGQIVKGNIDWDGTDPDDAIVFMIGLNNINDDTCNEIIFNRIASENFLNALSNKDKKAMKLMAKWKKVASESQKDFFKNQIQWLFENDDAESRFNQARGEGINTLATTTEQAYQESAEQPSSPLRAPTNQTPPPQLRQMAFIPLL